MNTLPRKEDQHTEFKAHISRLEREIVAFANSTGGKILIGLNDDGTRSQFTLSNALRSEIITALTNCEPVPQHQLDEDQGIAILTIFEGDKKPYKAPEGFFTRIGASTRKLDRDEILQFAISENRLQFDSMLFKEPFVFSEGKYFSPSAFAYFRERSKLSSELDDQRLLKNLSLIRADHSYLYPTHALALLFSRNISEIFPHARVIVYEMASSDQIIDQRVIDGTLFEQLTNTYSYLLQRLRTTVQVTKLKREEVPEFPEFILRELIVNALIHRDYFERGAEVQIKLFPDKLEVTNPAPALHGISPAEFIGRSLRRNPLIAEIFERAGYLERAGTGLLRIQNYLKTQQVPPMQLVQEGIFFVATLQRHYAVQPQSTQTPLSQRQTQILALLKTKERITSVEYAKRFKVSNRFARRELNALVASKYLLRVKQGRAVYYSVSTR